MQVVNLQFLVKRGVATYGFLITFLQHVTIIIFLSFFAQILVGVHQPKNIENSCFPPPPRPPKKRILLNFSVCPFLSPGPSWFSLSHSVSHPISEFSTSKSDVPCFFFFPRLPLLPSIFSCPLSPSFPLLQSLFFVCSCYARSLSLGAFLRLF